MDRLRETLLAPAVPDQDSSPWRLQALETALSAALESRPDLQLMLEKALRRSDGKVPPGSNAVRREVSDDRFVLSLAAIDIGSELLLRDNLAAAVSSFRHSLVWFPRSVEGNLQLARALKALSCDSEAAVCVERCLAKAVAAGRDLSAAKGSLLLQRELDCLLLAKEDLALLLCQQGRGAEAVDLLRDLGFTWRLADEVLQYPLERPGSQVASSSSSAGIVQVVDHALPDEMVEHLQHVFRSSSPFWREHHYDPISSASRSVGYFSYLYPFRQREAQCSVETIMDRLFSVVSGLFPRVAAECQYSKCVHQNS